MVGASRAKSAAIALGLSLSLALCLAGVGPRSAAAARSPGRRAPVVDGATGPGIVPTGLTALVADFDGDHRADVFWYAPGAAPDYLWLGLAGGGFRSSPVAVGGTYRPLLGDWNGDRAGDIFWYGPGADPDALWLGRRDARFTIRWASVIGTYQPFTGDFDGDHRRDIVWYAPGGAADSVWFGGAGGAFASKPVTVVSSFRPQVGDFGGDGRSDVLWYAPGDPDDVLWFGLASRRFSSRATAVDIGHTRALPLRPGTIAGRFNPYGFVAHAMGSVGRHTYTNSLEAFRRNYRRGFRVFETDVVRLADGTALLAHTGLEANYGLHKPFQRATWADLRGHKYLGRYTILRSQDLVGLLRRHPDAYAILDSKYAELQIYKRFLHQAPEQSLRERILPNVVDQAMLNALRTLYPLQNYVLALYRTQYHNRYDDPVVVDFARRNRAPAVAMWWRARNPALSLNANHFQNRRYRASLVRALKAAGAVAYVHSIDAPADARRFWHLRVGLFSNEPFPPLGTGTAPPQLLAPRFGRGVSAA